MKKILIVSTALYMLTILPASAQIIIQPTIIAPPPAVVYAPPPPAVYVAGPVVYPVHIDHHRRYDWRYWQERREHEHR